MARRSFVKASTSFVILFNRNVLQSIREAIETTIGLDADFSAANFIESQYKDRGKFYPEFLLTKDGFSYTASVSTATAS